MVALLVVKVMLVAVALAELRASAPPLPVTGLEVKLTLVKVNTPVTAATAPPRLLAPALWLLVKVTFESVAEPLLPSRKPPPPLPAPLAILFWKLPPESVKLPPLLLIAPPLSLAVLPEKVELVTVTVMPAFIASAPPSAPLPEA